MVVAVLRPNEVSLDGKYYPIEGLVRTTLSSQYPQKVVLGDVDKDSNPRTSVIVWDDWQGGIGRYSTDGKEGLNRSSFSLCETRFKGHLTLHKRQVIGDAEAKDLPVTGNIYDINELAGDLYATLNTGTDIWSWGPDDNTWIGSKIADLPTSSTSTDSLSFRLAGTLYIAFAHTRGGSGGYSYSSDGSSWDDDTKATKYLTFWDERLWGIYGTQLWFATAIGSEKDDAVLSLPWGAAARGLFTGPDASGVEIIYVVTSVGLYAHDAARSTFIKTGLTFPTSATRGATWNGEIYISAEGGTVYRYNPRTGVAMSIGLDRDAGLPSGYATTIENLIPTHTGLLAVLSGTGTDSIWEYNGQGWHFVYKAAAAIDAVHVSDAGSDTSNDRYRVYLASGSGDEDVLQFRALDRGFVNPDIATSISYEGTNDVAIHETPWFNAGQEEIDKTAIRVRIDCQSSTATSAETVKVEYALDYSSTYVDDQFTVTGNDVTTKTFPTIADNNREEGSDFRAIRFKLTLNRGSTAIRTPNVKSLSLEWRRKLKARYGFEFDIPRVLPSRDKRNQAQMKADIITSLEKGPQVEFTFVDEAGTDQNYFVDIVSMQDAQQTGSKEYGLTRVSVRES